MATQPPLDLSQASVIKKHLYVTLSYDFCNQGPCSLMLPAPRYVGYAVRSHNPVPSSLSLPVQLLPAMHTDVSRYAVTP